MKQQAQAILRWKTIVLCLFVNASSSLFAQPEAFFTYDYVDDGSGLCAPVTVQFTNASTGNIVQYIWEVEDSYFSDVENPSLDFNFPSIYQVCLSVTNTEGIQDTYCTSVEIFGAPDASFSGSPTVACNAPLAVEFIPDNYEASYTYQWDFGDGTGSAAISPIHQYVVEGAFDVALIITDTNTGCADTTTQVAFVQIGALEPTFDYQIINNGDCSTTEVVFSLADADNYSNIVWNFGDGTTSSAPNPTHIYTQTGCFTPSVSVQTPDGCGSDYVHPDCIVSNGPINISYSTQGTLVSCDTAALEVRFYGSANGAVQYLWNFGGLGVSNQQSPTFVFDEVGIFPVSMTAYFPDGCVASVVDTSVQIQPIDVSFEADTTSGCVGMEVQFQNTSSILNSGNSYFWDFEHTTSTEQSPTISFPEEGVFSVRLTVTTQAGCQNTFTQEQWIHIGTPPTADFSANTTEACGSAPIYFTNTSTNATEYWWDFGDGTNATNASPIHFFADTGYVDITLVAANNGCTDTLVREDYVHVLPPIADFTYNRKCGFKTVTFINNSIAAESYLWDFGDGSTSTEENPSHTYENFGTYTTKLTVFNGDFLCEDEVKVPVLVTNPIADFKLEYTAPICPDATVAVSDNSEAAVSYEWFFDDNNIVMEANSTLNDEPTFVFPYAGAYTGFGLIVTDNAMCQDTLFLNDTVFVSDVTADFEVTKTTNCFPAEVQMTSLANSDFGNIASHFWTFGDGTSSNMTNPLHTYTENGSYEISLTVKNDLGCSATTVQTQDIVVEETIADFEVQQIDCNTLDFHFTNTTATTATPTYTWDFGDENSTTQNNPTHNYAAGTYIACLTALSDNCESQYCDTLHVALPNAAFSADQTYTPCNDTSLSVQFTDESEAAVAWQWTFGDGNTAIQQHPSYTYSQAGSYDVCLTTTNTFGCTATTCRENFITVEGASAMLQAFNTAGCPDLVTTFVIQSIGVTSYVFDFGDGETLTGVGNLNTDDFSHIYTQAGIYYPSLTLVSSDNCETTYTLDTPIEVWGAGVDFSSTNTVFCADAIEPVQFYAIFENPAAVNNVLWEFEGASPAQSTATNPSDIRYSMPGTYTVRLTVQTSDCSETVVKEDLVVIEALPTAIFDADINTICANEEVLFENNSDTTLAFRWLLNESPIDTTRNLTYTFTEAGVFTLSLETTNANGCTDTHTDTIFISEGIAVDLEKDTLLCQNENVTLTPAVVAPNEVLYQWAPSQGLSCTSCPNPVAMPDTTTTYYLSALTSDGCTATDSIQVLVSDTPPPSLSVSADTSICPGTSVQLLATSDQANISFSWTAPNNDLSCYDCLAPLASPTQVSTYTVRATNQDGCFRQDSVEVGIFKEPDAILEEDFSVCEGEEATLTILYGNTPAWEENPSLSCTDCDTPTVSPQEESTYIVQVLSDNGCTLHDSITIGVTPTPPVFAGEDAVICIGDSILLEADYEGQVVWTSEGNVVGFNEAMVAVYPTQTTTYTLTVLNENCPATDEVFVEVYENSAVFAENYEICEGETIQLSVGGFATDFAWVPSPFLNEYYIPDPMARPDTTTLFTVIGTAGTCPPDTATVLVEVSPTPDIESDQVIPFQSGTSVVLQPDINGGGDLSYTWTPDTYLSCNNCPAPEATPDTDMVYQLSVEDTNGCYNTIEIQLLETQSCTDGNIVVPNTFTPNGDGNNDVFYVRGDAEVVLFQVYNRWGEVIFSTQNKMDGWDGTYKGQPVNRGVYLYHIEAKCNNNTRPIIKTGDITLIR